MSDPKRVRPATGSDVARIAGVSQATVSLVVTGKTQGRISDERRDRVLKIARELRYQPNASARSLRLGRAHTIALIVPNVANPFFASVLLGAERAARERQHAVMLLDTGGDPEWPDWVGEILATRAVDGCIVYAPDPLTVSQVRRLGRNVVLVEASARGAGSVQLDIAAGIRLAMAHLIEMGHRRIAHIAAAFDQETFRLRETTYRAALEAAGLPYRPEYGARARFDIEASTAAARQVLQIVPAPTAILCDDDLIAAGAYKAASALGRRIPSDLSVIGFDDIELARMLDPELTTVAIPAEHIGAQAMAIVLALVDGEKAKSVTVPLALRVRGSTGPPAVDR
ncbi:MAG TPA: LacI family DNA-binding transcriptional regulator [Candidatus Saccharimonadales bacterium]|nr:LacI family DNA-binding transcriptional regulator [Candidatus Saccharimonadales bacterium]